MIMIIIIDLKAPLLSCGTQSPSHLYAITEGLGKRFGIRSVMLSIKRSKRIKLISSITEICVIKYKSM